MSKDLFFEMRENEAMAESFHLNEDIISPGKDKTIYGRKGDRVTVLSDRGNTVIVEGKNGERFPVQKPKTNNIEKEVSNV